MPTDIYENPVTTEHAVVKQGDGYEVERIEFNKGIFIYLKGHPYPQKGLPTPHAIWAVNIVKSLMKSGILLFILNRNAWKNIAWRALEQHILKYEFLTPATQATHDFIGDVTHDLQLAKIISHVIEYDGAYRFRLMDVMSETSKIRLQRNPFFETHRLLKLYLQRETPIQKQKFKHLPWLALLAPFVIKGLDYVDFQKWQYDEGDRYWAKQKLDYDYQGTRGVR